MAHKLVVDRGNTLTKLAIFQNDSIAELRVLDHFMPADIEDVLTKYSSVRSSILSAVKNYPAEIDNLLSEKGYFIKLDEHTPLPFINKYETPNTLGKDRMAIAAEAHHEFPGKNVLAIDAGTTVTYDFINQQGEYMGGSISPGIRMRLKALHHFTDQLPLIELENKEVKLTGATTEQAILSGVINGLTAEIDGIIDQYRERYESLIVIFGGGDYKYFDKRLKNNIFATPNIVLKGLKVILEFNEEI